MVDDILSRNFAAAMPVVAPPLGDVIVASCFAALVLFVHFHGYIPRGFLAAV